MDTEFLFGVVLLTICGCFGIIGNILLIFMFMRLDVKLTFHRLMILLAIYDTIFIGLCIIVFSFPAVSEAYISNGYHSCIAPTAIAFIQISLTGSIYCTVGISIERYLTVCHPFYMARKEWGAKRYFVPIILFSIIFNISRFFELQLNSLDNLDKNLMENQTTTSYTYQIELSPLRKNKYYYSVYIIGLNFAFNGLIPFVIVILLNGLLYKSFNSIWRETTSHSTCIQVLASNLALTRSNRAITNLAKSRLKFSELTLAKVSLIVVFVFVVCHSIRWIPNIYELIQRMCQNGTNIQWPYWVRLLEQISNFLTVLNSSVNFYIYYITHYEILLHNRS